MELIRNNFAHVFERVGDHAGQPSARGTFKAARRRTGQLKEARDILGQLPGPWESVHCLISGRFDFALCLTAILEDQRERGPCKLTIATLSYNARNVSELCALIDAGLISELSLLVSSFFYEQTPEDWNLLQSELVKRGAQHQCRHARSHAKVTIFQWEDGSCIVIEGSANLRSNGNAEFITLFADPEKQLCRHHQAWIEDVIRYGHATRSRKAKV